MDWSKINKKMKEQVIVYQLAPESPNVETLKSRTAISIRLIEGQE